jgi:hypothetical protein
MIHISKFLYALSDFISHYKVKKVENRAVGYKAKSEESVLL